MPCIRSFSVYAKADKKLQAFQEIQECLSANAKIHFFKLDKPHPEFL